MVFQWILTSCLQRKNNGSFLIEFLSKVEKEEKKSEYIRCTLTRAEFLRVEKITMSGKRLSRGVNTKNDEMIRCDRDEKSARGEVRQIAISQMLNYRRKFVHNALYPSEWIKQVFLLFVTSFGMCVQCFFFLSLAHSCLPTPDSHLHVLPAMFAYTRCYKCCCYCAKASNNACNNNGDLLKNINMDQKINI